MARTATARVGAVVAAFAMLAAAAACADDKTKTGSPGAAGGAAAKYPTKAVSIMAPAAPGGGWDTTAREMQRALTTSGTAKDVSVFNVEGAGGTVGLAKFAAEGRKDPHKLMVMGLVMIGAIKTNKAPVDLAKVTPVAALTAEAEAIVVKADSKYKTIQELVADFKANPRSITWGGGSAGGTDHILVGLLAEAAGVDPSGMNYVAHSGGGEAMSAILSGSVTAGVSGVSEFTDQVKAGKLRFLAVSGDRPAAGVDAPTLQAAGINVSLLNWRGVVAPEGISKEDRDAVVQAIQAMHDSAQWKETLKAKDWADFYIAGDEFDQFLKDERARIEAVLVKIGLSK
jgi:putative tricarboxylic transport membrane protein